MPDARPSAPTTRVVRETVTVKDPELERRLARAELRVMEKEAQVAELQRIRDEELAELQQSFATFVADIDQRLADVERISRYIAEMPTNNIR